MSEPSGVDDPDGRQHERTALAWQRTALATVALGLFLLREADTTGERVLVGVSAALALVGMLAAMHQRTVVLHQRLTTVGPARLSVTVALVALIVLQLSGVVIAFT